MKSDEIDAKMELFSPDVMSQTTLELLFAKFELNFFLLKTGNLM